MDLEDIFDEHEVPNELRDEIASELVCQGCGCGLSRGAAVGLKTEIELEADKRWKEWHEKYEDKIEEFGNFLERYPYLGLAHEIGKKINKNIIKFPKTNIRNENWWRARKPKGGKRLITKDMIPPKHPKTEGRFNHYGQGVFYIASTAEAALLEVCDKGDCLAWLQKYTIKRADDILDLSGIVSAEEDIPILALGLINIKLDAMVPSEDSPWKPQYFIPRFIADCARQHGFNGIAFNSRKHYEKNLVLFSWDKNVIVHVGKPNIMTLQRQKK